jgi:conjugative relaxase-like TrwC/TraI family protein
VLSIGKIARIEYYLGQVASGAEDYYAGSGEAPGRWRGAGIGALGLSGEVEPEDYRAVFAGVQPGTNMRLVRPGSKKRPRLPGLDLTFSAPKSVSILYALAGTGDSGAVVEAHEAAVDEALGYLELHACFTRRQVRGVEHHLRGEGLVVAGFRHRTSRAGDPSLHTHCLVANMARTSDGNWGALHTAAIYREARTAGFVYQAVLRAELTRRLGVGWGSVRNGYADLDGVPADLRQAFSRRRAKIETALEERGLSRPSAARVATLDTRPAKAAVDGEGLRDQWTARAAELGFDPAAVVAATIGRRGPGSLDAAEVEGLLDRLASPGGLTRRKASFARRDIVQAICSGLRPGAEVTGENIEQLSEAFMATRPVVRLGARTRSGGVPTEERRRWSTIEMLHCENALIASALNARDARIAVAPDAVIHAAVAGRPGLADEQTAMVRSVCGSGDGVQVVIGAAGTGKTYALDTAREAWERSGHIVIGCALAARAARQLEAGSGIRSTTIAWLLNELDQPDASLLEQSVVVVDEASMVDTRTLARLAEHTTQARAKLLLVGDHHQLPEIDAGGAFAGLAIRLGAAQLAENRRQQQAWERNALDQLRSGDTATALTSYERHGRIITSDSAPGAFATMAVDWWSATQAGERALMIATRNADVDDLNEAARDHLRAAGLLEGPDLQAGGRAFAAGDYVLFTRADHNLGVINGTTATVKSVNTHEGTLAAVTTDGERVEVPTRYLQHRRLTHVYATTVHKAQGATVDRLLVYGDDRLYRESAYVALSRGRVENHIYIVDGEHDLDDSRTAGIALAPRDPLEDAIRHSAMKTMAVDERVKDLGDDFALGL